MRAVQTCHPPCTDHCSCSTSGRSVPLWKSYQAISHLTTALMTTTSTQLERDKFSCPLQRFGAGLSLHDNATNFRPVTDMTPEFAKLKFACRASILYLARVVLRPEAEQGDVLTDPPITALDVRKTICLDLQIDNFDVNGSPD